MAGKTDKHLDFMQQAYTFALRGWGKTLPNPMVGAVLVKNGKVIADGWHECLGADHAESMAIKKAGLKAKGCDLYVTLEPCSHFGRTPPCTQAIINAGIKRVYVGVLDPNPRMNGQSIDLLRKAGIAVEVGFLEHELNILNEAFNKYIVKKMPYVTAKIAQTIDGKVATLSGASQWITSPEARDYSHSLRNGFNAIMVGINTVLADDPQLNTVDNSNRLKKVIVDSHLRIPLNAKLFEGKTFADIIILTTKAAASAKIKALSGKAVVLVAPTKEGRVDLTWGLAELAKMEIASLLIEGGGELIGDALRNKLVDKMHIYIAPRLMGEGLGSIRGFKVNTIKEAITLNNLTAIPIGGDLFMEGYI